jgi:uncharacterized protein YlxW (UPF0749 family)
MIDFRKIYLIAVSLLLGVIVVLQIKSFEGVNNLLIRDSQSNIFQEITVLKEKNTNLATEVKELENTLELLKDQNLALNAIENEIIKYKKLSGKYSIFGSGVSLVIDKSISTPWIIDIINEFFNAGAQAVSINGIRISTKSIGFDTLPQGQVLLNGSILSEPLIFNAIGDSSVLIKIADLPGGIIDRLYLSYPNHSIITEKKEIIQMD